MLQIKSKVIHVVKPSTRSKSSRQIQQYHLNGLKRNIVHMGHFEAGEAINTVASHGYLEGTIRTYDPNDLNVVKHKCIKLLRV